MSLFRNPEDHAANPPETWQVVKMGEGNWRLTTKDGGVLESTTTRKEAKRLRSEGFLFDLYEKEGRWYAGEPVANWRPYADLSC